MRYTRLIGTGHYVPERIVTNDELAELVDTSDEWIRARTGIAERRRMGDGEVTSDMALEAGKNALEMAGVKPEDLDLLVVATISGDMPMPSCAVMTQLKLGAQCPAFDIAAACAGYSYGLTVVDGLVRGKAYSKVLFIGAEAITTYLNWEDRTTCVLFGDGASAVVCVGEDIDAVPSSREARGVLSTVIEADGTMWKELNVIGGGTLHPPSEKVIAEKLITLRMNGRAIFSSAVRYMSDACEHVLRDVGMTAQDVDWVIPHQANLRIIDAIARRLSVPQEKLLINLDRYGNTSAASIGISLDEAVRDGRIQPGHNLLLCGLGAGLTWGASLVRW